ncbi:MAG: hypothetical protein ABEJ56_01100, partial [Candidatus Nanohaloarchaea archaeon]
GDVDSRYLLDSGDKMTGNLNMTGKSILDYFDNSCGENQAVKQIYDNGTVQCGQAGGGLPTVLDINKSANDSNINNIGTLNSKGQQLDLGGELDLTNDNITDSTGCNVTIRKSLKIYGQIWLNGTGSDSGNPLGAQNLSDVLEQGNSAGSYNIDVNGNALKDVGALYDDSNTQCGSDEFLNGKGSCKTDSFAADTDDQDLEDVLAQYNDAGAYDINLSGSEIQDTDGAITLGGGNVDIPDGDLDMTENNITNIDSLLDSTGSKTINFDGSNNVEVPNGDLETTGGDLNMSGNNLTSHQEVCAGDMCT